MRESWENLGLRLWDGCSPETPKTVSNNLGWCSLFWNYFVHCFLARLIEIIFVLVFVCSWLWGKTHPDQLCKELDVCASFTQSCLLPKCFTILTCETSKTQDIYRVVFFNGSAQKFQVLKMAKPLPKKWKQRYATTKCEVLTFTFLVGILPY